MSQKKELYCSALKLLIAVGGAEYPGEEKEGPGEPAVAGAGAWSLWPDGKAIAGYPVIPESSRDKGEQTKGTVQ